MRAKAWLVENGHLESDGRGRMPLRVIPILEEARKNGTTFSDWPKGTVTKSEKTGAVVVKREASMSHEKIVQELAPETYPMSEFVVFERVNGKRVMRSLKEACNNCRVSLVGHYCESPTIVSRDGNGCVRVYIERK